MARRRRRKRPGRTILNFGASPPSRWYGEIVMLCPEIGEKTIRVPGPTATAAVRNVTHPKRYLPFYAMRCRILKRRIVGSGLAS